MTARRMAVCLVILLAVLVTSLPAGSGEIGKGTVELALAGGFERSSIEEAKLTSLDLGTRLTYSITNRFAMGGTVGFAHLSEASGYDATSIGLSVDAIVNFSTQSTVVPFGQVSLGVTTWSGDLYDDAELSWSLPFIGAGFRVLLGDYASVNVLAGYRYQMNAFGVKDLSAHDIVLAFGLSAFPGGIK